MRVIGQDPLVAPPRSQQVDDEPTEILVPAITGLPTRISGSAVILSLSSTSLLSTMPGLAAIGTALSRTVENTGVAGTEIAESPPARRVRCLGPKDLHLFTRSETGRIESYRKVRTSCFPSRYEPGAGRFLHNPALEAGRASVWGAFLT